MIRETKDNGKIGLTFTGEIPDTNQSEYVSAPVKKGKKCVSWQVITITFMSYLDYKFYASWKIFSNFFTQSTLWSIYIITFHGKIGSDSKLY